MAKFSLVLKAIDDTKFSITDWTPRKLGLQFEIDEVDDFDDNESARSSKRRESFVSTDDDENPRKKSKADRDNNTTPKICASCAVLELKQKELEEEIEKYKTKAEKYKRKLQKLKSKHYALEQQYVQEEEEEEPPSYSQSINSELEQQDVQEEAEEHQPLYNQSINSQLEEQDVQEKKPLYNQSMNYQMEQQNVQEDKPLYNLLPKNCVDIGNGVYLTIDQLSSCNVNSFSPNSFARRLLEIIFTVDELKSSSLFGRQCNINKAKKPLPPLDQLKLNAILDYTVNKFSVFFQRFPPKEARRQVVASLASYLYAIKQKK